MVQCGGRLFRKASAELGVCGFLDVDGRLNAAQLRRQARQVLGMTDKQKSVGCEMDDQIRHDSLPGFGTEVNENVSA